MNEPMNEHEFWEYMESASFNGPEEGHMKMDALMVQQLRALGYGAACDVFEKTSKWYA